MTNQAIIIIDKNKNRDFLFKELNGKIFLHYQLSYLSENLFKKVIFIEPKDAPPIKSILGNSFADMELQYEEFDDGMTESESLIKAFEQIDDIYAFVFDAHQYFRLNMGKADDFRRMRDSRMLHIGKKYEEYYTDQLPQLEINEKGRIIDIKEDISKENIDTFFTNTWLINKVFFRKTFDSTNSSLLEILQSRYQENREFCLACRQYFTLASSEKELENLENDIREYHYQ